MEHSICIFGDSITWGVGDPERGGWAERLKASYITASEAQQDREVTIYNLGIPGDTTEDVLKRFALEAQMREPTIALFAIGLNDAQYIDREDALRTPLSLFKTAIVSLGDGARECGAAAGFIGLTRVDEPKTTPIPWSPRKYYVNRNVEKYDSVIRDQCEQNGIPFLALYDLLSDAELSDGLHPDPLGHEKIARAVRTFLHKEFLKIV